MKQIVTKISCCDSCPYFNCGLTEKGWKLNLPIYGLYCSMLKRDVDPDRAYSFVDPNCPLEDCKEQ